MSNVAIREPGRIARTDPARKAPDSGAKPGVLKDLLVVFLLVVALRGSLYGLNYVGRSMTHVVNPAMSFSGLGSYWDGWVRWDSGWFMDVVKNGYHFDGKDFRTAQGNPGFFPLYPYSIRALTKVVGGRNHWYAGLFLSNVCLVFALYFVLRIGRRYLGEEGARRSLVYLLLFPSSFYFSAYYAESMFLLTTAASFYYFLDRRFFLCGVCGFLAALTRNPGVVLFPAFVLSHLWNTRGKFTRDDLRALWLLLIPCGLLTYMVILYYRVGDPLAFVHLQTAWGRKPSFPLATIWEAIRGADWTVPPVVRNTVDLMDIASSVAFLIIPFCMLRKFDKSMAIFSFLVIVMPLSTGMVVSMLRYALSAFPVFFVLARLGERRDVDRVIVSISSVSLVLLNLAFANWHWTG